MAKKKLTKGQIARNARRILAQRVVDTRSQGVTFNRVYHPATKFKGVIDYGKIQSQFIKENK